MRALVLGATGFIGSNLVRALLERGDEVRALVRPSNPARTLSGLAMERVHGDLDDPESVAGACRDIEVVYQAASYYPTATIPVKQAVGHALAQTDTLLAAIRRSGTRRLVFTSTLTTIGFPPSPGRLADEDCPFVTQFSGNPYLMAKAAMEDAVLAAARQDVPAVVVNPTMCLGPYDSKPTSGTQIVMIAKRLMPAYVDGPINVIDVRDVAIGMIKAAERGRIGERYILGNWNTTHKELNGLIARIAGVAAPKVPVPFPVARYGARFGDWACRTILRRPAPVPGFFVEALRHMQQYNCSKAMNELDYPQQPVERAVREGLAWFRANGYV